jgi:MbtH protein
MAMEDRDLEFVHKVVVNDQEQYSIWPLDRPTPPGWRDAGKEGSQQACLDWIDQVWTDMRPLAARARPSEGRTP